MTGQPLDIKIESRNVGMTPRWKTEIERRVQALETGIIRPTHARVTLTKNAHHNRIGPDRAKSRAEALERNTTLTNLM